ncbi:MAG: TraB/GumN family protein [Bacteroidales bacterium]
MNKFILITCVLFVNLGFAQQEFNKGLLWKVSGNGLKEPSYIFGTLHVICPDEFIVFPGVEDALKNSEKIILELDISDPQVMIGMQMGMVMKDNKELSDILNEDEYATAAGFFSDSLRMNISMFSKVQPFFLISMAIPHMIQCNPVSYENYFIRMADTLQLELAGLETLQEQLNVFDALTYREQAEMLIETFTEYDSKREEFMKMLRYYLSADLQSLEKLFADLDNNFDEFSYRLIRERNERWIGRLDSLMNEKPSFIAVGAGHLPGENGILKLLLDQGYIIERVN